ncbi:MAG: hypothetical protein QXQ40_00925 [Candidatus Aenigmatarchaeota archaeon]
MTRICRCAGIKQGSLMNIVDGTGKLLTEKGFEIVLVPDMIKLETLIVHALVKTMASKH